MREIRFRALVTEDIENLRGERIYTKGDWYYFTVKPGAIIPDWIDKATISQYMERKDKNGKGVWEGNILQFSDRREWYRLKLFCETEEKQNEIMNDYKKYPYERRVVSLDVKSFFYEWFYSPEIQTRWEVIGDKYTTPELLPEVPND